MTSAKYYPFLPTSPCYCQIHATYQCYRLFLLPLPFGHHISMAPYSNFDLEEKRTTLCLAGPSSHCDPDEHCYRRKRKTQLYRAEKISWFGEACSFCLNLPATFSQPHTKKSSQPCTICAFKPILLGDSAHSCSMT